VNNFCVTFIFYSLKYSLQYWLQTEFFLCRPFIIKIYLKWLQQWIITSNLQKQINLFWAKKTLCIRTYQHIRVGLLTVSWFQWKHLESGQRVPQINMMIQNLISVLDKIIQRWHFMIKWSIWTRFLTVFGLHQLTKVWVVFLSIVNHQTSLNSSLWYQEIRLGEKRRILTKSGSRWHLLKSLLTSRWTVSMALLLESRPKTRKLLHLTSMNPSDHLLNGLKKLQMLTSKTTKIHYITPLL